jgi:H+/Cl- antiporter ClcA
LRGPSGSEVRSSRSRAGKRFAAPWADGAGYARALLEWIALGALVGIVCGIATAIFLLSLEQVTRFRIAHEQIVFALPLLGIAMGLAYDRWGRTIRAGNNLIIDTIHEAGPRIPLRMAPMVLLGTLATHLFGGSAGREGTAVQMGASLADAIAGRLRLGVLAREGVLVAGIAGGFGAAFGTPIAGVVFGLEVLVIGRIQYHALLPALVSSVVADFVARSMGVVHAAYPQIGAVPVTLPLLGEWIAFGAIVAAVAVAFVEGNRLLRQALERRIPWLPVRMAIGGAAVVVLWQVAGTDIYLGLGVPTILGSFTDPNLPLLAFAWKMLFTVVTLSVGFVGGEVTPLLFVGAALGATFGRLTGIPVELAAGVGLAAVFGAAANTPLALSIMAVEMVGAAALPHVAIVMFVAYLLTGHRGIYPAQRLGRFKDGGPLIGRLVPLRELTRTRHAPVAAGPVAASPSALVGDRPASAGDRPGAAPE